MSKEIEILDAAEPEPTPPPPMSLSGWDAIFAIRFGDVNKAIAKMEDIPQKVEASSLMKDKIFKNYAQVKVDGKYESWSLIGTDAGSKVGALTKISKLTATVQKLKLVTDGSHFDIEDKGDKFKYFDDPAIIQFKYDVGIPLSFHLNWYSTPSGQSELKMTDVKDYVDINMDKIIAHPEEDIDFNDPDIIAVTSNIKTLLRACIEHDVVNEFNHIFATVDYTQQAGENAPWLQMRLHEYSVAINDIQLTTETTLHAETPESKIAQYNHAMDIEKGYPEGVLMIVGMTKGSKDTKPASKPSDLIRLVPAGCKAAYAYSNALIIPNVLFEHLTKVFVCDPATDFDFNETKTSCTNNRDLVYRKEVTIDFLNFAKQPTVTPTVLKNGVTISIEGREIIYSVNLLFSVDKGVLGFGLPYGVDILQKNTMTFEYKIAADKYAELSIKDFNVNADLYPKDTDTDKNGWKILGDFALNLAENLLMMGLTLGMMKLGSLGWRALKAGGKWGWRTSKTLVRGSKNAAAAEKAGQKAIIAADEAMAQKALNGFETANNSLILELESSGNQITNTTELKLIEETKTGKQAASNTQHSIVYELIKFTIWQTMLNKASMLYHENRISTLTKDVKKNGYATVLNEGVMHVNWGNQDKSKVFRVVEGELRQGSFVVGLDIDFHH